MHPTKIKSTIPSHKIPRSCLGSPRPRLFQRGAGWPSSPTPPTARASPRPDSGGRRPRCASRMDRSRGRTDESERVNDCHPSKGTNHIWLLTYSGKAYANGYGVPILDLSSPHVTPSELHSSSGLRIIPGPGSPTMSFMSPNRIAVPVGLCVPRGLLL